MNKDIAALDIATLLTRDSYRIPLYQRNYDWSEREALQLLRDIADYACAGTSKKYYLGSLVVFKRGDGRGGSYYETIDGQQRLTTLTLLACALKNLDRTPATFGALGNFAPNLSYDHRAEADSVLEALAEGRAPQTVHSANMVEIYKLLKNKLSERFLGCSVERFCQYLLSRVVILRITVPRDTQLNHYFEIMNSRGEQLEKHEILKANLMEPLGDECHDFFNRIWEACSDMNSYVQMNLPAKLRGVLFGDRWEELRDEPFDALLTEYRRLDTTPQPQGEESKGKSIAALIADAAANRHYSLPGEDADASASERFGSIINFPNFLLHALKIYCRQAYPKDFSDLDIVLDDKKLLDVFNAALRAAPDREAFAKGFVMELLRLRALFDKYVIKRESTASGEGWSLKRLKKYDSGSVNYVATFSPDEDEDDTADNREIAMLQAMFHVSAPTQIYKYWLYAVLHCVRSRRAVEAAEFASRLRSLARSYMLDRYLNGGDSAKDYFSTTFFRVVHENDFRPEATVAEADWSCLDQGCSVENFVFNYYDYVLWHTDKSGYPNFEFTYRTSVEHFYPQTPPEGYPPLPGASLHSFGNLCLISRGMNSRFGNNMPLAKYANFANEKALSLSIKLRQMMEAVGQNRHWNEADIDHFTTLARATLSVALSAPRLTGGTSN